MKTTLAGLAALVALATACMDSGSGTFTGPSDGAGGASQVITMTPTLAVVGAAVTFTSQGLFDHDAYSRSWDFGDGGTADGRAVSHIYQNPGAYAVTLVGYDGASTRTATMAVSVAPAADRTPIPPQQAKEP